MSKKLLRSGLVVMLTISLLVLSGGHALAGARLVDQQAELDLKPTIDARIDAVGTARLELRIDAMGLPEQFRVGAEAEGLAPNTVHSFFVGGIFIDLGITDADGNISFDEELTVTTVNTLLGLKVKVVQGSDIHGTVVLFGKVTEVEERL